MVASYEWGSLQELLTLQQEQVAEVINVDTEEPEVPSVFEQPPEVLEQEAPSTEAAAVEVPSVLEQPPEVLEQEVPSSEAAAVEPQSTEKFTNRPRMKVTGPCGECKMPVEGDVTCDECKSFMHIFHGHEVPGKKNTRRCSRHYAQKDLVELREKEELADMARLSKRDSRGAKLQSLAAAAAEPKGSETQVEPFTDKKYSPSGKLRSMTTPKKQAAPSKSVANKKAAPPAPSESKRKSPRQPSPGQSKSIVMVGKRTAVPLSSAGHNDRRTLKKLRMIEEYENLTSESEHESN